MKTSRIALWIVVVSLLTVVPVLADGGNDDRVIVVTHLDIIPTFTANAQHHFFSNFSTAAIAQCVR